MVMLLTAIVSVAILGVFSSLNGVFSSQTTRIQNQDDARTAVNQMGRYVRMATSSADNLTSQSNAIAKALPQDIEFYCDLLGDGVPEKVRYYLDGATLLMQTAEPELSGGLWVYPGSYDTDGIVVQEAIRNGSAPVFTYHKYDGPDLVECSPESAATPAARAALRQAVVTVTISVTVNAKPELADGSVVLATDVQIRQRYDGELQ
jgi:hypothetical protein